MTANKRTVLSYCAVSRLLFSEDVMGSAQHYDIAKVVTQAKEPEEMRRCGSSMMMW